MDFLGEMGRDGDGRIDGDGDGDPSGDGDPTGDPTCPSLLQILFAWSVPSAAAIDAIVDLGLPVLSMGAGAGYWEWLLGERGVAVDAFDSNSVFRPSPMAICILGTHHPSV